MDKTATKRLQIALLLSNIKRKELAKKIGISQSYLTRIINGDRIAKKYRPIIRKELSPYLQHLKKYIN